MSRTRIFSISAGLVFAFALISFAQEKSVKPGINDPFKDPDVNKYVSTFEGESREVSTKRKEIVTKCQIKPGLVIADVGAGTGLFTRPFANEVGEKGKVFAVDISKKFLEHIAKQARDQKQNNIETVLCNERSTELKPASVDLVFLCDTYHHFEFPHRTLESIHQALKPGGSLVVIDFKREPGKSREWILNHVRAGQPVVEKEITESGFKKIDEIKDLLQENYFVRFEKVERKEPAK